MCKQDKCHIANPLSTIFQSLEPKINKLNLNYTTVWKRGNGKKTTTNSKLTNASLLQEENLHIFGFYDFPSLFTLF